MFRSKGGKLRDKGAIITWSRWEHQRYAKIGGLTIDWGEEMGRVGRHLHMLRKMPTNRAGSNRKPHICSSCEEVLTLTWLVFFQISTWYVGCYAKIFVLLYFVWKHVIDKTRAHENQRIVLELYLSANGVLKKTWMYKILWIPLKFSKSIWSLSSFLCKFHVWVVRKKTIGFRFHENKILP